ncbi:MAG: depupylase/deamidase Dop [Acidimicrobiia bacterium]
MALPKVLGIETEYGVIARGVDLNPVSASSVLINAYAGRLDRTIGWDFEDERPGADARGFSLDDAMAPEVETHLVNTVLTNGARYYVDHAHPEYSSPECRTVREAVTYDRAGEEILRASMTAARAALPDGAEIVVYKNNSDGKGNSYGCHENYLLARDLPFGTLAAWVTPHLVTRQVYCGAGKVGHEGSDERADMGGYQISQRADFFEEEIGLETTLKRPIVNTRDEPHADPSRYRRLHVIVGDANMSEVATYLKLGTTALVLAMIEDGDYPAEVVLAHPVSAIRVVSHDPSLRATVLLSDGRTITALALQRRLWEAARAHVARRGHGALGEADTLETIERWGAVLDGLETDPDRVAHAVDWVAKRRIIDGYAARHGLGPRDARRKAIDLQYHDLRAATSLAARAGLEPIAKPADVDSAVTEPPTSTRAYFRGRCLAKWPRDVVAANWDSIVFDVGAEPLRRVPMMEPLKGTAADVAALLDDADTPMDLVTALGAQVRTSSFRPTN